MKTVYDIYETNENSLATSLYLATSIFKIPGSLILQIGTKSQIFASILIYCIFDRDGFKLVRSQTMPILS